MKKNSKSTLSEYFTESVPGNIKPYVTANTAFKFVENGTTFYVMMLLNTEKIGYINKKTKDNAQIGGMIEKVKSGSIDLFMTSEQLEKGELVFVPTATTIDGLADYGMFTNCNGYEFVKYNNNLELVERTGVFASYNDFRDIGAGKRPITDFLKPKNDDVIQQGSKDDPTSNHSTLSQLTDRAKTAISSVTEKVVPVVTKAVENVKEKVADSSGIKDMVQKPKSSSEKVKSESEADATTSSNDGTVVEEKTSETEEVEEEVRVYTETEVYSQVTRIFHADNLDLPLSSEPFDQLFTLNNHLIEFDLDQRDTYVNERLNVMAGDANRDLRKLRSDNLKKLREKYFALMSDRILKIQAEYDLANIDTEYGQQKWAASKTRDDKLSQVAGIIEERRNQLEADYEKDRDEYCESEAKRARNEYNEKHQRTHNDMMNQIEGLVKGEIEEEYNRKLGEIYMERRDAALSLLDLNITQVLQELAEDYKNMFDEENVLYTKRADEMREYAKKLHEEDAKRLAIEEERNRISNEVNDARAEASAKIELIKKEYETAQAALKASSDATIAQAENETKLIREQMDARTATLENDKELLQKQLDDAIVRADRVQEIVKADYEHRIVQAQDDRDSWKQTLDAYKEQHKHNNRLAAILVIAITIAAVAGGFVAGGVYWNRFVASELSNSRTPVEINVIESQDQLLTNDDDNDADVSEGEEVGNAEQDDVNDTFTLDISENSVAADNVDNDKDGLSGVNPEFEADDIDG